MSRRPLLVALLSVVAFAGCKDREVTAYRAPKDPAPPATAGPAMAGGATMPAPGQSMPNAPEMAPPSGLVPDLHWKAPSTWQEKPSTAWRRGSYSVPGPGGDADLSIVVLPAGSGSMAENIRRWRGQVGLPAVSDLEIQSQIESLTIGDAVFAYVALVDPTGKQGILGGISNHDGADVFVKLSGSQATLAAVQPEFRAFLNTVLFH